MNIDLYEIAEDVKRIQKKLTNGKTIVPLVEASVKSIDQEVNEEIDKPNYKNQKDDTKFLIKAYKWLRKLGYVNSQYQFSEQFLNKNRYYFSMVICEQRHPSIDSVHNLMRNISILNDGVEKKTYLDKLSAECEKVITQRLFRYF